MGACDFKAYEFLSKDYRTFDASELPVARSQRDDADWNAVQLFAKMMDINERRIVQKIKTIANLEHRYNPYNSSWGLVLEYCKQLLEGEKK